MNDNATTLTLVTKAYGEMEIDARQQVHFPHGLIGFEQMQRFAILDAKEPPFFWLQSIEEPGIAWVLIDPTLFRPDYRPAIRADELDEIGVTREDEPLVFSIVTIPEDPQLMTANLQAPVIINRATRVGRQSISTDSRWQIRHRVLDELSSLRQGA